MPEAEAEVVKTQSQAFTSTRSRVEATLSWFAGKPLPGSGCDASKHSASASWRETRTAEIHIRIALLNRFSALGTAEIVRVG